MGDIIHIWEWRKPDRKPSKRGSTPVAAPAPSSNVPALNAPLIETYTRSFLDRLKEGMHAEANPFFITVDTTHAAVSMPAHIRVQYPYEIILVLQNVYDGLQVMASGFKVRLYFAKIGCEFFVPFSSVKRIIDQRAGLILERKPQKGDNPWVA